MNMVFFRICSKLLSSALKIMEILVRWDHRLKIHFNKKSTDVSWCQRFSSNLCTWWKDEKDVHVCSCKAVGGHLFSTTKKGDTYTKIYWCLQKNRKMHKNVIENISFTMVVTDFILRVATRDPWPATTSQTHDTSLVIARNTFTLQKQHLSWFGLGN